MKPRFVWLAAFLLVLWSGSQPSHADLPSYMQRPEPTYRWEKRGEKKLANGTVYELFLVSQTWKNGPWTHRLQVFRPDRLKYPHFCTLLNTGGGGGRDEEQLGMTAAQLSGASFAVLYHIPNQPLYGGLTEDALIVYTWGKFLETSDEDWPLHFPMAKAVLKAMDTIQAHATQAKLPPITDFMITGASKRGWTTWLTAASGDRRIKAIAPMVIDTLNVAAQIPHQIAAYGQPSEQVGDYTAAGMLDKLNTPQGKRLMELEDPYTYRAKMTLPKLLILGTNDRYWAQDALNLYWDGLVGPKWVSYTPNSGHGLEDRLHVVSVLTAFTDTIARKSSFPQLKWKYEPTSQGVRLNITCRDKAESARLFRVAAPTQDFRDSKWTAEPMTATKGGFTAEFPTPATGFAAIFGEVTYKRNGKLFTLSTQIQILGKK